MLETQLNSLIVVMSHFHVYKSNNIKAPLCVKTQIFLCSIGALSYKPDQKTVDNRGATDTSEVVINLKKTKDLLLR